MFCFKKCTRKFFLKFILSLLFGLSSMVFFWYYFPIIAFAPNLLYKSVCNVRFKQCSNYLRYCNPVFMKLKGSDATFEVGSLQSHPNLPEFLLNASKISCLIPDIQNIRWTGIYWQESWSSNPKFLLYSAHLDEREAVIHSEPNCSRGYIRIVALYNEPEFPKTCSCQIWFNETDSPMITPVHHYDLIDWQGSLPHRLLPYIISCPLPFDKGETKTPTAVSVVNNTCETASNILQVTGQHDTRKLPIKKTTTEKSSNMSIGICGPAIYYYNEDFSHRLTEWIEIMLMIGASKVILYEVENHINVKKLLSYYAKLGKVHIVHFRYPPPYLDEPSLRAIWTYTQRTQLFGLENIYFTDCILRFKDDFQYLAHFDPDEVPILKKHQTLIELIQYLKSVSTYTPAYYHLKWKTFYPETPAGKLAANISENFYILRHNRRPESILNPVDDNGKSIYDTSQVLAAYSHKALLFADRAKLHSKLKEYVVNPSIAYTAHFRNKKCGVKCNSATFVEEEVLINMKKKIIDKVNFVFKRIKLDSNVF